MSATVFEIAEKVKDRATGHANLDNFVLDAGIAAPLSVLDAPNVSLFCLNDDASAAIFVETPPDVEIDGAPFYYQAQYEHALRAIAVPIDEFHRVADAIEVGKLIFVHSTGRCGSTLISQALATVEGVRSLSEPDIYTQIHEMRHFDAHPHDDQITHLLASATRFYARGTPTLALKFRAMCISVGDLLYESFPNATNLFLYRNAETWARSMNLDMRPIEVRRNPLSEENIPPYWRGIATLIDPFMARHGRTPTANEMTALGWLSLMEHYMALYEAGVPFLAARYEDIKTAPKQVVEAILAYCGLDADAERIDEVLGRDSQAGTEWSQQSRQQRHNFPLEEADFAQFRATLRERPLIRSADFVVPATLQVDAN